MNAAIIVTPCGINQLYYEARHEDFPGIVGLGLTPDGSVANFKKCREQLDNETLRMLAELAEAEGEQWV